MTKKSVLITGCSSGIGLCVAKGLAQRGYRVFATARQKSDVEKLNALGIDGLESFLLDLTDSVSIDNAVKEALQRSGGTLYGLFNNGAYGQPGAVEDLRREVLRAQFETNLFGWLELTNKVVPVMRKQGYGRIVQNSSILGFMALPFRGAYNASKYALEGLSDTLRLELHGTGIFVSIVEPGPVESRFRANSFKYFKENIDWDNSPFAAVYYKTERRLSHKGPVMPFTLPPEAVLKKVMHALESKRPKIRYYVTVPTYVFGFLRRVLPYRAMDWLLRKAADKGSYDKSSPGNQPTDL